MLLDVTFGVPIPDLLVEPSAGNRSRQDAVALRARYALAQETAEPESDGREPIIATPWGQRAALVQQGLDGAWYAVLRDPAPQQHLVPGVRGATRAGALDELAAQCAGEAGRAWTDAASRPEVYQRRLLSASAVFHRQVKERSAAFGVNHGASRRTDRQPK